MKINVLTLFPEMFAPMNFSMMGLSQKNQHITFKTTNIRDYSINKHQQVDDYPYGGGAGMLLRVEPIVEALEDQVTNEQARIILVDPTGQPFTQAMAQEWSTEEELVFVCGHYEGFDERIRDYVTEEVSLGDYVLTNGELPAMVMIDATVRLIPEVVGNAESIVDESHQGHLLEHPQYTRPRDFRGKEVPEVLLSGHHERIRQWQREAALLRTYERRPDLLAKAELTSDEQAFVQSLED